MRLEERDRVTSVQLASVCQRINKAEEAAHWARSLNVLNAGDLLLRYRIIHEGLDRNVIAARNNGLVSLHKLENANLVQIEKGGLLRLSDRALAALGCDVASKM